MTDQDIIRCANICDDEPAAQVCELMFHETSTRILEPLVRRRKYLRNG